MDARPAGHTIEIVSLPAPGGWIRRVSVLGVPECTVDSTALDVSADVGRVLALLAERLAAGARPAPGTARGLRPDLDVVARLYRSGG
ncbi:hypothetical protein RB614_03580 [Phytohabitans sp. ZYX-F-186]|uniref:DUF1902 domain-containing protein n=1 Tax=Phytohabitans maris TaxID=3071409 RepID=A0ABU0ZB00_9ACTN|nr:hypothetical protein [Phytohabitans sp. ZYX-F-186]MDQ7903594.1 hypothetical protein [Phytohabitans sp. ZYX-F-186]